LPPQVHVNFKESLLMYLLLLALATAAVFFGWYRTRRARKARQS
jgi:hypothetical protein